MGNLGTYGDSVVSGVEALECAVSLADAGDLQEAERCITAALGREPALAEGTRARAQAYASLSEHAHAIPFLSALANRPRPELTDAALLGWHLLRLKRLEEAEAAFARVIEIDANRHVGWEGSARVARARGHHAAATAAFRKASDLNPADFYLSLEVCRSNNLEGAPSTAREKWRALAPLATDEDKRAEFFRVGLEIGWVLQKSGAGAAAQATFADLLAIDPAHRGALQGLIATPPLDDRKERDAFAALIMTRRPGETAFAEIIANNCAAAERRDLAAALYQRLADCVEPSDRAARERMLRGWGDSDWRGGQAEGAKTAYLRLLDLVSDDDEAFEHAVYAAKQTRDRRALLEMKQRAAARTSLARAAVMVLARALMATYDFVDAVELLSDAAARWAGDTELEILQARAAATVGDATFAGQVLRDVLARRPGPADLCEIGAILTDMKMSVAAEPLLREAERLCPEQVRPKMLLGFAMRSRGDDEEAVHWFRKASALKPEDHLIRFEVAVSLFDLCRANQAEAELVALETLPPPEDPAALKRRRAEFACMTMRLDEAAVILGSYGADEIWPVSVVANACTLAAFRGEWARVLMLFRERVIKRREAPINNALGEAVGRAARALGEEGPVLADLSKGEVLRQGPSARALHDQLVTALRLAERKNPEVSAASKTQFLDKGRAEVCDRILTALSGARKLSARGDLYLCSDAAFAPGVLVTLSSLLRNNAAVLRNWRLHLFVSDAAAPIVCRIAQAIGEAHAASVAVVPISKLDADASAFRVDWGFFSPGHRLSEAAYWRIHAALWLAARPHAGRALYIDGDVSVGPGLGDLLKLDLMGHPIAARMEDSTSPSIRRTARKLGIPVERYFNSGVLLMDLCHQETVARMRRALDIARSEPERLSYVDQCALNLAFAGQVTALPETFNCFVRSNSALTSGDHDAVVQHYLGRPKPWNTAYPSANALRWLREFEALSEVVAATDLWEVIALV